MNRTHGAQHRAGHSGNESHPPDLLCVSWDGLQDMLVPGRRVATNQGGPLCEAISCAKVANLSASIAEFARKEMCRMNCFVLSTFSASNRIGPFHSAMFHGWSTPDLRHNLGGDLSVPLRLKRNCYAMPEIFSPVGNLVVSDRIRNELSWVPNVEFLRVELGKLFSFPYAAGKFTARAGELDPLASNPEILADRLPNKPELRRTVGSYFEIVSSRISDLQMKYGDLKRYNCSFKYTAAHADLELLLSRRLLIDNPIVWQFKVILADRVFDIVSPFLNLDYYEIQELTIGE